MDSHDIARLVGGAQRAGRGGGSGSGIVRFATVASVGEGAAASVVPDGREAAVPAVRCCDLAPGDRAALLPAGTQLLAVARVGGPAPSPELLGEAWRAHVLFSDDGTGQAGDVALSEPASSFDLLRVVIGFADTAGGGCQDVYAPSDGKLIDVDEMVVTGSTVSLHRVRYRVEGAKLVMVSNNSASMGATATTAWGFTSGTVRCRAVIGYRA